MTRTPIEAGAEVDEVGPEEWTALMFAARDGHDLVARLLLEKGADPNVTAVDPSAGPGWTALLYASQNGYADVRAYSLVISFIINLLHECYRRFRRYKSRAGRPHLTRGKRSCESHHSRRTYESDGRCTEWARAGMHN